MANNINKPNDFIAASINSGENITLDDLHYYDITPDNTGIQSEDYYKRIPQIQELFTKDGKFDNETYSAWYQDNLDLYNQWTNTDYEEKLIDSIERSPYDIFHTDNTNVEDTSAKIVSARDPERTARGLTFTGSNNGATFDIREVAQANYVLDENGNELDWTPNDKGGLIKGLYRPALALAQWDEDGYHYENGMRVEHHAGDLRYGKNGDPCYQILGSKSAVGKDVLHYSDTFTADDSLLNKFDFFDNDGLKKSVGGTLMRTAVLLTPMFIPGVNTAFGWGGAALALAQTAPVLARSVNGAITGDNDNGFGQFMNSWENLFSRFNSSTSREAQNAFFSKENVADMVISSANQLFQQRNVINAASNLIKLTDARRAQKIGSAISLGYMAATSANDTYSTFKQAGLDDRWASIGTLATTLGLYGLMDSGYLFKDAMFKNTWLAEDQERRQLLKTLADYGKANLNLAQTNAASAVGTAAEKEIAKKWYTKVKDAVVNFVTKGEKKYQQALTKAASEGSLLSVQLSQTPFWQSLLSRGLNEGIEEVMEEGVTDVYKGFTLALNKLGVDVTDENKDLDFKETWGDILGRYATAFIGGYVGGMTFEGFSEWDKLVRNNFKRSNVDRSLVKNLIATISNPESRAELDDEIDRMEKKGLFGNKNLSAKLTSIYDDSDPTKVTNIIFEQGTDEDNQNKAVAAATRYLVNNIKSAIDDNGINPYDVVRTKIYQEFLEKAQNKGVTLEEYLKSEGLSGYGLKMFELSQKGALDGVYNEMVEKSVDIVTKELAIRQRKADIKNNSGSDANKEEAKKNIAEDLTIKQLEKEKKQLKEEYDELVNGDRTDYYASVINFASNGYKMLPYIYNPDLFQSEEKDILPYDNFQDYVMFKYGIKIDDPNLDDKYVEAKKAEWEHYKEHILPKQIWRAHQLHYNLSEQLSGKLTSIDTALKGYRADGNVFEQIIRNYDAYTEAITHKIDTTLNPEERVYLEAVRQEIKDAKRELLDNKDELIALSSSTSEDDRKKYNTRFEVIKTRLDSVSNKFSAAVGFAGVLDAFKAKFQNIVDNKIVMDVDFSDLNDYANQLGRAIEKFNNLSIPVDAMQQSLSEFILKSCFASLRDSFGDSIKGSVDYAFSAVINLVDESGRKHIGFAKKSLNFLKTLLNINESDDVLAEDAIMQKLSEHEFEYIQIMGDLLNNFTNPTDGSPREINASLDEVISNAVINIEGDDELAEIIVDEILGKEVFNSDLGTTTRERASALESVLKDFRKYCDDNPLIVPKNMVDSKPVLASKMKALESALKNGNFEAARNNFNEIKDFIFENLSEDVSRDAFMKYLFTSFEGNTVYTSDDFENVLEDFFDFKFNADSALSKVKQNPIWDIFGQISTYTNERFSIAIKQVRAELDRFNSLGSRAEDEYVINEPGITNELETALRLTYLVNSLLGSTVDGHNVIINQYRSLTGKTPFAIINNNSKDILGQGLQEIAANIQKLLAISKKNSEKQLKMQKDTFIKCYPKLAEKTFQLVNACNNVIKPHADGEEPTEEEKWKLTEEEINELRYAVPDELNEFNFVEEKKKIDDFYEKLRNIILSKRPADSKESDERFITNYLKFVIKSTPTLYQMTQTELSPFTESITDFTGFQNLVTNLLENAKTVDSIYRYVNSQFPDIHPFQGQEFMIKTAFVFGRHVDAITELEEAIQEQGKTPNLGDKGTEDERKQVTEILNKRPILRGVIHFDGTAGAGKTELTRMLGKMFEAQKPGQEVIQVYSAVNRDHVENNLKPRLGTDTYQYVCITDIVNDALGGKAPQGYELETAKYDDSGNEITEDEKRPKDDKGKIIPTELETVEAYAKGDWLTSKLNPFLNDGKAAPDGTVKIWVIDEDGFMTPAQWEVITILAKEAGAFIVGTGDSFQNGATYHNAKGELRAKDIFDYYAWTTPFLSISMRAQNRGKLLNQQFFYSTIKEINKGFTFPFCRFAEEAEGLTRTVLESKENVLYGAKSDTEIFGEVQVDTEEAVKLAKELSKDHTVIIVTDTDKKNSWNVPGLNSSNVKIMDRDSVQGGQADYVIIDRSDWDSNSYLALKDIYTMASRSKIGTAFVQGDIFSKLGIVFKEDESAKFAPSPEDKKKEIETYKIWRENLFEKTTGVWDPEKDNIDGTSSAGTGSPSGAGGSPSGGSSGGSGSGPGSGSFRGKTETWNWDDGKKLIEEKLRKRNTKIDNAPKNSIKFDLQGFLNILSNPDIDKDFREAILKMAQPFFDKAKSGGLEISDENKIKILKLLSRIIIQNNSFSNDKVSLDIDYTVKTQLNNLGLRDDIIGGLSDSLKNKSGFYYLKEISVVDENSQKLGFYAFTYNKNTFFIPCFKISELKHDNNPDRVYGVNDFKFNEIEGTCFEVSSEGKSCKLINDVFDIDGGCQIAILKSDLGNDFEPNNHNHSFIRRNSGKAFFVMPKYAGYSTKSLITPVMGGPGSTPVRYLINGHFEKDNVIPYSSLIGVQAPLDLPQFLEIMRAKRLLLAKNKTESPELYEEALNTIAKFFGQEAKLAFRDASEAKTGALGDDSKTTTTADFYNRVRSYNALHWKSSSKFFSSLLRFLDDLTGEYDGRTAEEIRSDFYKALWENLNDFDDIGWFRSYKSAIALNINGTSIVINPVTAAATDDKNIPGDHEYEIIISTGKGDVEVIGTVSVESNLYSLETYNALKNGRLHSFDLVKKLLEAIKLGAGKDGNLKGVIAPYFTSGFNKINEDALKKGWDNGNVAIGFTKIKREKDDDGEISVDAVYQGFDEDLARACNWLLGSDFGNGTRSVLEGKLKKFLEDNTLFKHALFASIVGKEMSDGWAKNFWKTLDYNVDSKYLTTDVVAYFEAAYTIDARNAAKVEDGSSDPMIQSALEFDKMLTKKNSTELDTTRSEKTFSVWKFRTPFEITEGDKKIKIESFTIYSSGRCEYNVEGEDKPRLFDSSNKDEVTEALRPYIEERMPKSSESKVTTKGYQIYYSGGVVLGYSFDNDNNMILTILNIYSKNLDNIKITPSDSDYTTLKKMFKDHPTIYNGYTIAKSGTVILRLKLEDGELIVDTVTKLGTDGTSWRRLTEDEIDKYRENLPNEIKAKFWPSKPKPTEVKPEEPINYTDIVKNDLAQHTDILPSKDYKIEMSGNEFKITFSNTSGTTIVWKGMVNSTASGDSIVVYTELPAETSRKKRVLEIRNSEDMKTLPKDILNSLNTILSCIEDGNASEAKQKSKEFKTYCWNNAKLLSEYTLKIRRLARQIDVMISELENPVC